LTRFSPKIFRLDGKFELVVQFVAVGPEEFYSIVLKWVANLRADVAVIGSTLAVPRTPSVPNSFIDIGGSSRHVRKDQLRNSPKTQSLQTDFGT
jgi:hypothetical protein